MSHLPSNPSEAFRKRNPHLYQAGGVPSDTKLEPDPFDEPQTANATKTIVQGRCRICFTSFRQRLLDSDNLAVKSLLDSLTEAGVIADDSLQHVQVTTTQVKVSWPFQERTEIEITPLPEKL